MEVWILRIRVRIDAAKQPCTARLARGSDPTTAIQPNTRSLLRL